MWEVRIIITRNEPTKINWRGIILAVQPRTTVWRYKLDNRTHSEIGYNLFLDGEAGGEIRKFCVAISEKQQQSGGFRIGDEVKGTAWTKMYCVTDYADYYRAGSLKKIASAAPVKTAVPPWIIDPPVLEVYSKRGARMLSSSCWKGKCFRCVWATMSAVEIEYNWGVTKKYRFESFCYGPKSCKFYKMGNPRAVPYKDCGSSYDEGWMDDLCTEGRGIDEYE